jgi:putative transposase
MQPEEALRLRLIEEVRRLPAERLPDLERFLRVRPLEAAPAQQPTHWPHAPLHRISEHGTYIVTAGTYQKEHHFADPARLDYLHAQLLELAAEHGWQLEAWAVFSNHYHFVAHTSAQAAGLKTFIKSLHGRTSHEVNQHDGVQNRTVWCNYRDTQLTFEKSYFARLNYVHQNAVKHGLVRVANQYPWCSAAWFERTASRAMVQTIYRFKTDKVQVPDDYNPI